MDLSIISTHPLLMLSGCTIAIWMALTTKHFLNQQRVKRQKSRLNVEKQPLHDSSGTAAMGTIVPLQDFDYRTAEPLRVYKFQPKYFLTMGLQNTDINHIMHIDSSYLSRLAARRAVADKRPEVLACLPGAEPVVHELYTYLVHEWLPRRYPTIFKRSLNQNVLENEVTGEHLPLTPPLDGRKALEILNQNVDDDVLLMCPQSEDEGGGFALNALMWAFPNHSDPKKRLGGSLRDLHQRVPRYREKLELSMDRFFGKLEVGKVVCRSNWGVSIKASQDESQLTDEDYAKPVTGQLNFDKIYVRCELQTLFRLPVTGARIFTIHEYVYPLQQIKDEGLGPAMIEAIAGLKTGNVPEIWDYRGASSWSEQVRKFLQE